MNAGRVQAEEHPVSRRHDVQAGVSCNLIVAGGGFGEREGQVTQVGVHTVGDRRHLNEGKLSQPRSAGNNESGSHANGWRCRVQHRSGDQASVGIEQVGRRVNLSVTMVSGVSTQTAASRKDSAIGQ